MSRIGLKIFTCVEKETLLCGNIMMNIWVVINKNISMKISKVNCFLQFESLILFISLKTKPEKILGFNCFFGKHF